ncbi:hypothetical protein Tco_1122868 [Tanacetum coccineum]|uniref:Uncharacterized protein n=1 Tax=Tanacetum coccineum TaxID=301880 RepID=A0ABQ5J4P8_9ASTR
MLEKQKTQKDKHRTGFTEDKASTSNTKTKRSGPVDKEMFTVEQALSVPSTREPASSIEQNRLSAESTETLEPNIVKKNSFVQITRKPLPNTSVKNVKQAPILKLDQGLGKKTMRVEESLNVRFDEIPPPKSSPLVDDDIIENQIIENQIEDIEIKVNKPLNKEIVNIKETKDHPVDSVIEPKNVKEAIQDESWTMAMQEELNQFKTNDV